MFNPTIMTDVAHSIQSDRLKEAEKSRLLSAIKSAAKADSTKKYWRIHLPKAVTSRVHNLLHPVQASSAC